MHWYKFNSSLYGSLEYLLAYTALLVTVPLKRDRRNVSYLVCYAYVKVVGETSAELVVRYFLEL